MKALLVCLVMLGAVNGLAMGDTLTLNGYLNHIQSASGYQGAVETEEAFSLQKEEAELGFSPQLVASVSRNDNHDEQIISTLGGSEIIPSSETDSYEVALVKKWKVGLTTSLNYDWTRIDSTTDGGVSAGFQVQPSASATLSLWRDFLGKQSRAQSDQTRYQTESSQFSAAYQREQWLYQARVAYWSLQLARETVEIRRDTLSRAVSIVSWSKRRSSLLLGDDAEFIQARATQRVRELELQQALESERTACSDFNRYRGISGEGVTETLEPLESSLSALNFDWPEKAPERWDVKSSEAQVKVKKSAWQSARSNVQPDLNAFVSLSSNGTDLSYDPAARDSLKDRKPNTLIGAQLTVPLDVFKTQKIAKGYELSYKAAILEHQDKLLQTEHEWERLHKRLNDVNQRLSMVAEIETIQKEKVEKEQKLLRAGRTTQYQVQSYEGDYSSARLQRLSILAEKLDLWAEGELILSAEHEKTDRAGRNKK